MIIEALEQETDLFKVQHLPPVASATHRDVPWQARLLRKRVESAKARGKGYTLARLLIAHSGFESHPPSTVMNL